jgi:tetratricopeptide (TPR) repeat protein
MARAWLPMLLASFILMAASQSAALDGTAYNEANRLYRSGRFGEAAERYERLLQVGSRNSDLFYNLGNAYYKAGSLGRAILNYERALALAPDDADIRANLRYANAVKRDQMEEEQFNLIGRAILWIYNWLTADGLAVFCSLCLFVMGAVGITWLYLPARRTLCLSVLVAVGVAVVFSSGILAVKIHQREMIRRAVVLADEALARSGPGEDYLQVFAVHEGTTVVVEREEAGWFLVRLHSGIGGWLAGAKLEEI